MAEGAIYKAIPQIMAEVGAITKDRKNAAQGYSFRGIDDIYNALHSLFIKYKVFTVPEVVEAKDDTVTTAKGTTLFYARLLMRYTFYAEDGSSFVATVRGEGMDSGDKASNKAMAVAHKYALIQVFAIPTENGDDPENESHEVNAAPPKPLTPQQERFKKLRDSGKLTPAQVEKMTERWKAAKSYGEQDSILDGYEQEIVNALTENDALAGKAF